MGKKSFFLGGYFLEFRSAESVSRVWPKKEPDPHQGLGRSRMRIHISDCSITDIYTGYKDDGSTGRECGDGVDVSWLRVLRRHQRPAAVQALPPVREPLQRRRPTRESA